MAPKYFFDANDGRRWLRDLEGTRLHDAEAAHTYALTIIHEVMRNNEAATRHWRLRVRDGHRKITDEIAFASVEPNADRTIQQFASILSALAVTVQESEHLIRKLRSTLDKVERKPYLAVLDGRRIVD